MRVRREGHEAAANPARSGRLSAASNGDSRAACLEHGEHLRTGLGDPFATGGGRSGRVLRLPGMADLAHGHGVERKVESPATWAATGMPPRARKRLLRFCREWARPVTASGVSLGAMVVRLLGLA